MVNHTRLDCVIGVGRGDAAGGRAGDAPRRATGTAFGKRLIEQPLMRNVLADLVPRVRGRDDAR